MQRKIVYFIRHGQSIDNTRPVFQSPDTPLSEQGQQQAAKIAHRAAALTFDTLLTSPLKRADQTADAITKTTGKAAIRSNLFVERVKPNAISGKPYTDTEACALWRAWEKSMYTPGLRVEEGENFDDLICRADRALAFLTHRAEPSLMVVTHGYFLRTLVARVLLGDQLSPEAFKRIHSTAPMENTGLTVFQYTSGFAYRDQVSGQAPAWQLWVYNDYTHLS